MELNGSVAIVTGGASGLGAATAKRLVAGGARVVLADLNDEKGEAFAAELGDAAIYKKTNVASEEDVQAAIDAAPAAFPEWRATTAPARGRSGMMLRRGKTIVRPLSVRKLSRSRILKSGKSSGSSKAM